MDNIILEELRRFALLSNYNTRKTLSENLSEIYILDEQRNVAKQIGMATRTELKAISKELDSIMSTFKGGITDTRGVRLTSGADIIKSVKNGTLVGAELGKVNIGLFKTTTNSALKTAIAKDISLSTTFRKRMMTSKNEAEAITNLMNGPKKYSKADAQMLVNEYKNGGGVFGGKTVKPSVKPTTKKPSKKTTKPISSSTSFNNWKAKYGNKWKGMSRKQKILAIAATGLGIYLLWNYFKTEDQGIFSDCVLGFMTDDDLALMSQRGFGDGIIITQTPNRQVNAMGGIKLFTDGTLETVTGNVKGTWNDKDKQNIIVTIGDDVFTLPCSNVSKDVDDSAKDSGSGADSSQKYEFCPSFPYELYCKNENIRKIQQCIGVKDDSYLGPITKSALEANGYTLPLSEESFNKIIENCFGKSSDQSLDSDWKSLEPEY